ncbi:MAG: TrbG/VirB9 family P-type conjugative transfer protein [Candidatus Jidaibacter sp.]|jgi:type IV secretion system protein VirB9|nr:TrbG/VirB9 family P-type conjugative transfer protein [Candidatus Jidaibacter sp.]
MKFIILTVLLIGAGYLAQAAPLTSPTPSKGKPIALDSRIKTYIYNENEVFRLVIHHGYQTSIEFAEGEEIQTISVGNNYAWQITPIGRRLFIKPLEENIATNMTILTNKRSYHFDIESRLLSYAADDELVYVVRFFFPENDFDTTRSQIITTEADPIPTVKPFNFNYTFAGKDEFAPLKVFDDGINTFFKFPEKLHLPKFEVVKNDTTTELTPRRKGEYIILNSVAKHLRLVFHGNHVVNVYNEKPSSGGY